MDDTLKKPNFELPHGFCLENFVSTYVSEALQIAEREGLALSSFDKSLRSIVSKKMKISEELVVNLHHAFHWTFFNNGDSIFQYVEAKKRGDQTHIELKRNYTIQDIDEISNSIFSNYHDHLIEKIRVFQEGL